MFFSSGHAVASWNPQPAHPSHYGQAFSTPRNQNQLDDVSQVSALSDLFDTDRRRPASLQSEMVDFTANIHGGWSLDNCKQRLNQFFQANKISADYTYSIVGPDHSRYVEGGGRTPGAIRRIHCGYQTESNGSSSACLTSVISQKSRKPELVERHSL